MPNYLVKLFPRNGKFFFGNDPLFIEASFEFYLRKSAFYPQQTSVLGMVQRQLLEQNALLEIIDGKEQINSLDKARSLIGENSFDNSPKEGFGIIKKISPVYIIEKGNNDILKEYLKIESESTKLRVCFEDETLNNPVLAKIDVPKKDVSREIRGKDVETEEEDGETSTTYYTNYFQHLPLESGVNKEQQNHIPKDLNEVNLKKKKNDLEGFYKNQFGSFNPKTDGEDIVLGFCFFVELALGDDYVFESTNPITFGKEKNVTAFMMQVEEYKGNDPFEKTSINAFTHEIRLISDAYFPKDILTFCESAVTETVNFKNIIRNVEKTLQTWEKVKLSENYCLFKRGSVFYLKKNLDDKILKELDTLVNQANFQQIGYNYFTTA